MKRPPPGVPGIPPEVYAAISVFTDEELEGLSAWVKEETGEFLCIGFVNEATGKVTKYANPEKYDAIVVMEEAYRQELLERGTPFNQTEDGRVYWNVHWGRH